MNGTLPIWLATGGTPTSSVRAGIMGLPIAYAIIGGYPKQFAPLADLYRKTAKNAGHPEEKIKVSVASLGLIKNNSQDAKDLFYKHWSVAMAIIGEQRGWSPPTRDSFERQAGPEGALFAGNPEEIANRIVALHRHFGHMRQFFQMDLGGLPQSEFPPIHRAASNRGHASRPENARSITPSPECNAGNIRISPALHSGTPRRTR